jgi:two-component system OmpR family sensor kinase
VVILKEAGDKVILIIRDSGPGIPDEYRNRVFEWFFRVTGNSVHGSGLGFAIIEQVVKLHHAEVKIFTPASGKGLEVNILFPAH